MYRSNLVVLLLKKWKKQRCEHVSRQPTIAQTSGYTQNNQTKQ